MASAAAEKAFEAATKSNEFRLPGSLFRSSLANDLLELLDEKGEKVTTEKFKHLLFGTSFSKILFVLGGTDGFSEEIINLSNKQISLSKMTLTHSFAAIILLEQIYRSVTIKINHPYHRA